MGNSYKVRFKKIQWFLIKWTRTNSGTRGRNIEEGPEAT